jgi:CPA2 family monovalent cation:H+ antiporter-2
MAMLGEVLVMLAASVLVVALFRRLQLSPILGYLAVGFALGPEAIGLIGNTENVRFLAEFGVVFLLFTIGLEFSLAQLAAMRWTVLGMGGTQVLVCLGVFAAVAWLAGVSAPGAVVIGGALALSSTAIVIRQLTEQIELHTRHGRRAVGVLLMQDLAVVPLLILIPILAGEAAGGVKVALLLAVAKGIAVFLAMIWIGRAALRPLFHEVARARSNELFTLAVLLVALLAAWFTHLAGLSLALGGFLAGIMLGETEYRHQIEADIRPFRDVLLGLFFITIGMLVDPHVLLANSLWVVAVAAGVIAFKAMLVHGLSRLAGDDGNVAMRTGIILAQGGEFGFALLALALGAGLIDGTVSQIALAAIVVTMALAPTLIHHSRGIAERFARSGEPSHGVAAEAAVSESAAGLSGHVLICGYGRTGQNIAQFLELESIPYLALDLDPFRVRETRAAGDRVGFGDSARREILTAAGIGRARLVVVSYNDPAATLQVLAHVRELRPELPVVVRTGDDVWLEHLERSGATVVVPEILEASLMLASHTLTLLDLPLSRVFRHVRDVRSDRYRLLRGYFHGEERVDLEKAARFREQLHAVTLSAGAFAVNQALGELGLEEMGVSVTAVRRGGIRGPQPEPDTRLMEGDVLVLYGIPENLERAEALLLGGLG